MAVELIRDVLKVEEIKGKEQVQTLVEAEIYLNQTKPDIGNILWTDGKVELMNTKLIQDKILVSGIVNFKVVYRSKEENPSIQILETNSDFKEEIEIEGINEEMKSEIVVDLEYIEHELLDERKVSLKALVNIKSKVEKTNSLEVVKDIKGGDGLQTLREKIKYSNILGTEESNAIVKEAFGLDENMPAIEEILKVDLNTYEKESNVSDDRVILAGVVECSIIYYGGEKLNSLKREISFNHFVEMPGIPKNSDCQLKLSIADAQYELKEDLEGNMKVIDLEAKIHVSTKVYEQVQKEAILDAYSTRRKVNIKKDKLTITETVKELTSRETVKGSLNNYAFGEIYNIEGKSLVLDCRVMEGKIIVEGILSLKVLCSEEKSKEIMQVKGEVPFKTYVDIEENYENIYIEGESAIEDITYRINDGRMEVETTIKNILLLKREKRVDVIQDLQETDEMIDKRKRPSVTIYMVQKGDTLWDISKRYNTIMEELIASNNILSPDSLMPGEKIIIEKNVDLNF